MLIAIGIVAAFTVYISNRMRRGGAAVIEILGLGGYAHKAPARGRLPVRLPEPIGAPRNVDEEQS